MTVIVVADVHGQTEAGYDGMIKALAGPIRRAEEFVLHSAYCVDGQGRVVEVWRSKGQADRFSAEQIAPHLPPGVRPKRTVHEAHSVVAASIP